MSIKAIESKKVGKRKSLTNKCTFVSTSIHEIMVGSAACIGCTWHKSHTKTDVDCGFKRIWT
jgi:hypothetical protein